MSHQSVLLKQAISGLEIKPNGFYIDATFGRGGHSQAILNQLDSQGRLLVVDRDPQAIAIAKQWSQTEPRLSILADSFNQIKLYLQEHHQLGQIDGLLADLGVSSPQLDEGERGFSFAKNGPLDMRMDTRQPQTAQQWLNKAPQKDISDVLKEYGEERYAKRIARAIVERRQLEPIQQTVDLANIIAKAHPAWEKNKHPATRSFQAIRIYINKELDQLSQLLNDILEILKPKGRVVIISFHSLEDKIVKKFYQKQAKGDDWPSSIPIPQSMIAPKLKIINKAIRPDALEIEKNPRARSAILRVAENI